MHACCCSPRLTLHSSSNTAIRTGSRWPSAYLGLLLQAGALLAIGTFISTLTKNQIIAGAATFGVCLLLWVLEWVSGYETATWAQVLSYLSVITHFESFAGACSIERRNLTISP